MIWRGNVADGAPIVNNSPIAFLLDTVNTCGNLEKLKPKMKRTASGRKLCSPIPLWCYLFPHILPSTASFIILNEDQGSVSVSASDI